MPLLPLGILIFYSTAQEAMARGLVNAAVAAAELESATHALAANIAAKPAHSIRLGKDMFYQQLQMDLAVAYAYASERMACNMDSHDAREVIDALIQKRKPEGVVTHHRGAYLNAVCNILAWNMAAHPVYRWTLPMLHGNGWCFPQTIAALNGTSICLRNVRGAAIFEAIGQYGVTHLCGAPVVLNLMANAGNELAKVVDRTVNVMTAGAAPPSTILEAMARLNLNGTHTYGLTEVYGPAVVCSWHDARDQLSLRDQSQLKARQGVRYPMLEEPVVADPETLEPVPNDGKTIGEVMFRGNIVMKGYLRNSVATAQAFAGGYFHSADLAVCHPHGYIEIRDRAKEVFISGGENISSIEVEAILYRHPAVLEAAVTAMPDRNWGESPCAFVDLRTDAGAISEQDLIGYCRDNMAHFKVPRKVVFGPLPKTSTGQIRKFELRERARRL